MALHGAHPHPLRANPAHHGREPTDDCPTTPRHDRTEPKGARMLRVGPDRYEEALARPHGREMDFTGRALKGMVYVGTEGIEQDGDLEDWLSMAVAFAGGLPPK